MPSERRGTMLEHMLPAWIWITAAQWQRLHVAGCVPGKPNRKVGDQLRQVVVLLVQMLRDRHC